MKLIRIFMVLAVAAGLSAQDIKLEVELATLPQNVEELLAVRAELASHPSGAAVLFVAGLMKYYQDPAVGTPMLIAMLVNNGSMLDRGSGPDSYRGYSINRSNKYLLNRATTEDITYVPNTYVVGTQQQNGYALPSSGPYRFEFQPNPRSVISETEVRIYIKSTGGVMPRPIRLERNSEGIWKVAEFSSLVVGVANLPPSNERDEL